VTTAGYEYSGAGADVGLTAWGEDLPECLRQCALAVFNLIVPTGSVEPLEGREVAARGASPEALLVNWLNECLYVHEIEGFAVARVEVDMCRDGLVHGVLHGEPLDQQRHHLGTIVKAATHHHAEVRESEGRVDVRVVVDV